MEMQRGNRTKLDPKEREAVDKQLYDMPVEASVRVGGVIVFKHKDFTYSLIRPDQFKVMRGVIVDGVMSGGT